MKMALNNVKISGNRSLFHSFRLQFLQVRLEQ
jgi:hypothetical protein